MTWIYIAQCGEGGEAPVKIGRSDGPEDRVLSLQTGLPYELRLVAKFRAPVSVERDLHQAMSGNRLRGEWFKPDQRVMDIVSWYAEGSGSIEVCGYWVSKSAA